MVIALCDGSYSPTAMADTAAGREGSTRQCEKYTISLFANAFMENQKLFRLILSHCRRNDCVLTPMLSTTLLELTLDEWNAAKWTGDMQEVQKLRHDEAISVRAFLTVCPLTRSANTSDLIPFSFACFHANNITDAIGA